MIYDSCYQDNVVHGFGFSVLEEEVNRRMVVVVKDVVVGGPAYKEGQLQSGDILLSVDGKPVIGKPYNQVRILATKNSPVVLLYLLRSF